MNLRFIKDYIEERLIDTDSKVLAHQLGISVAMLSNYKHQGYNASLDVAKKVYSIDGTILHPFSKDSLKYEISKGR